MEGVAALFNDNLLALDEISQCSPHDVSKIVYSLANGVGKQRASRTGAARSVVQWTCAVLSSGERTITTELASARIKPKAGQLVRLLDIPVARRYGVWDNSHGLSSGAAFSDAIKRAVSQHHGHAGVAFLERLTRDHRDWRAHLESFRRLPEFAVGDAGQDTRAAARFDLLALAGELATEYGVTGWAPGQATDAAVTMFRLWQSQRRRGQN